MIRARRNFGILFLLLLSSCLPLPSFAAAPWWNKDWKHRVAVTAPREARHSMLVELDAPQAKEDGSDIRVLTATQDKEAGWRLVHRGAEKKFTIEIALPDFATVAPNDLPLRFFIYYGNAVASKAAAVGWNLPSVTVEIHLLVQGQQPETWDDVQFLLERTRRGGDRQFVPQISPDVIVFDHTRPQLDIYRAALFCPEDGEYAFSLDSSGASFLVIDDALVLAHSGNPRWGKFKASNPIKLSAGLHRLELYHLCLSPSSPVSLGWETPQMRKTRPPENTADFHTVLAESLFPPFHARQISNEKLGEPLNAFFTYTQRGAVRVNEVPDEFITVQFSDATVASSRIISREWNFSAELGDTVMSKLQNPTYVFRGTKPHTVKLTVTDIKGDKAVVSRVMEFEKTTPIAAQVVMEMERLPAVITSDSPLNLSVTVKNLRKREMEMKLNWMPMRFYSPTDKDPQEFRSVEKSLKLGADDDYTAEIKCPPPNNKPFGETTLFGFSQWLTFHDVVVNRAFIRFVRSDDSLKSVEVDGHLFNENGEIIVLVADRLENRADAPPTLPKHIVCLDDTLCGNGVVMDGGESFSKLLETSLKIPVRHIAWNTEERSRKGVPTLYKFTQLDAAPIEKGDLVILSLGLPDLHDHVTAADYEKQIMFIADYLRLTKGASVLLVAPPPVPSDPEASRAYAKKVVQTGLQKDLPVLDLYSLMSVRSDWRDLFRDTTAKGHASSYLYYPNGTGQKWIAEEMARAISKWK